MRGSVVKRLLLVIPVVVALILVSLFMPARRLSIEGIGKLSLETTVTLTVGSEVAYAAPDTETRYPTGDSDVLGTWTLTPADPATRWDKIDEAVADDNDYITLTTAGGGYSYHTYSAFTVPIEAKINNVTVYYRHSEAAPAFPTVAAVNGGNSGANVTSHTINLPSGIVSGDLLIVFFSVDANPTVTWPSGWTQLFATANGTLVRFECRYRIADGTEGSTISLTTLTSEASAHTSYRITGYSGTPEAGTSATGTSINPNPPSLTPSWGAKNTLWIAAQGYDGGNRTVTAYPTNYTNGINNRYNSGPNGTGVGTAQRQLNAASEDPGTFTISGSQGWVANTVAIQPDETSNTRAAIKVGGTLYGATDAGADPTTSWADRSYAFTVNPKTLAAWNMRDVNGTGTDPLQAFGVNSTDSFPNISISRCYCVVDYSVPDISVSPPEGKAFGIVAENSSYWSKGAEPVWPLDDTECFFTLTNNSSTAVTITIKATNFSSVGVPWTLTSGSPGENTVRLKAGKSGDANEAAMVTLTTSEDSGFITAPALGAGAHTHWEIKLETGTFTDGVLKTSIVTLTAIFAA